MIASYWAFGAQKSNVVSRDLVELCEAYCIEVNVSVGVAGLKSALNPVEVLQIVSSKPYKPSISAERAN
jgi:hypothetical protein